MEHSPWLDFSKSTQLLFEEQLAIIEKADGFVEFLHQPHFSNEFLLQIVYSTPCKWNRITWDKMSDIRKFDPIENLKYIGQTISPTMLHDRGTLEPAKVQKIKKVINKIKVTTVAGADELIILDGTKTTVRIGNNNWETQFTWTVLPNHFSDLENLTRLFIQLNEEL